MAVEEKDGKEKKVEKKSKGLLIVVIILLLIVLGGGGFVAYKMLLAPQSAPVEEAGDTMNSEDPLGVTPKKNGAAGVMYDIPAFVVNLTAPAGTKYLRISLTLEVPAANKKIMGEIETNLPKIKDAVIFVLSSKTYEEISTSQGKLSLKQELLRRINTLITSGKIMDIYLTEFVIQA